nr:MAG TPA: hypothetical protein [Bacteriophage sp.]
MKRGIGRTPFVNILYNHSTEGTSSHRGVLCVCL